MRRQHGYTLVELIAVLVLVATIVAIGAGAMSRKLPGQRLQQSAKELAAQLRHHFNERRTGERARDRGPGRG